MHINISVNLRSCSETCLKEKDVGSQIFLIFQTQLHPFLPLEISFTSTYQNLSSSSFAPCRLSVRNGWVLIFSMEDLLVLEKFVLSVLFPCLQPYSLEWL